MKLLVDAGKRLIKDPIDAYYAPEDISAEEKMGPMDRYLCFMWDNVLLHQMDIIHSRPKIVSLKRRL